MNELFMAAGTCFVLGVFTTMHPCPVTTNLAAISLLTSWSGKLENLIMPPALFISGYLLAFFVLSALLGSGFYAIPEANLILQRYIPLFLGPVLIVAGMFHADLIHIKGQFLNRILARISGRKSSGMSALPMGVLLALSFCPATAAIFFGALLPLALSHGQVFLFPLIYAAGASIPLVVLSFFAVKGIAFSGKGIWIKRLPMIGGWLLILIGIYLSLKNVYLPIMNR